MTTDPKERHICAIRAGSCWFVLERALWPTVLAMVPNQADRDYAVQKLYGNGNGFNPGEVAFDDVDD